MGRESPATFAGHAAFVLVAGYFPEKVVEKALRKTLLFWASYDGVPLPTPLRRITVLEFARIFQRHLQSQCGPDLDMSLCDTNAAALGALREWWQDYRRLCELM